MNQNQTKIDEKAEYERLEQVGQNYQMILGMNGICIGVKEITDPWGIP